MGRKSFLNELVEQNKLSEFIQKLNDGATYAELAKSYDTSIVTICNTMKRIKEQTPQSMELKVNNDMDDEPVVVIDTTKNNKKEEKPLQTPYQILYANRKRVVELRKQGYYNVDIAKIFGVEDKDVFDFFDKRVKLTPEQYRDIKISYNRGKSIESLAQQYGVAVETIERMLKVVVASDTNTPNINENIATDLDCIPKFWQFIHNLDTKIAMATEEMNKCNGAIQDLMHKIEIEDCDDKESLEMVKKIKELRNQRRESKDFLELVEPFVEFLKDEDKAKTIKELANIAGRINNKAKQMNNRVYFMRTMEEE